MASTAPVALRGSSVSAPSAPDRAGGTDEQALMPGQLSHAQILRVMTGLLAALFTAMLSTTIVSTALPTIMADLHGTQRQYTWVITASLLAMTISTPIFGKLSDLFSKKILVQLSIVLFVAGSVGAGLSQTVAPMMAFRALQGTAMGGLVALTQSIMGAMIPPRQRGRYSGYMGAVMAVSTVSGPLLGGVLTDNFSWRWCFFVCVPLAVVALVLLQLTLRLTQQAKREVRIDYLGALLIALVAALPMVWVTFAGSDYDWISWPSAAFLGGFVVAVVLAVVTELRVSEPMVPIRVLRNRTTAWMIVASIGVGVAMFGSGTFLTQYFQLAGGHSPTRAGLMTIPMIVSQMLSSTLGGQLVTRTGRWKPLMAWGSVLMVVGLAWLGTLDHTTPYWQVALAMSVMGIGVGALIQNIVLAVQNTVDVTQIGASSATISFFRSLGGAVGVSVLGAILANHVASNVAEGLRTAGIRGGGAGQDLDLKDLPEPVRLIVRAAYGDSFGTLFAIAAAVAVLTVVAMLVVREVPLRNTVELRPQPAEPATGEPVPAESVPAAALDEPDQRRASAALDVLTVAQDQARRQPAALQRVPGGVPAQLDQAGRDMDAAVARFHAQLDQIKAAVEDGGSPANSTSGDSGDDRLRGYEHGLLVSAQQTADKLILLARHEAERILTQADEQVAVLNQRIASLRQVEAELAGRVAEELRRQDA